MTITLVARHAYWTSLKGVEDFVDGISRIAVTKCVSKEIHLRAEIESGRQIYDFSVYIFSLCNAFDDVVKEIHCIAYY